MCCGLGHLDFVHYRRTGDLIALKWSLARSRVSGRWQGGRLSGRKKLRASGKELRSLLYWAHLQGHPETCPKEAVSTKGLLHRVFLIWEMFLLFHTYTDSMQVLYPGDLLSHSISFQGPE